MLSIAFGGYGCFKVSCQIDEKIRVSQKLTLIGGVLVTNGFPRIGVSRRVGKGFPTHGGRGGVSRGVGKGFPTHGGSSHPRGEFTHTGYQEGWERDFPPTGGVLTHGGSSGGVHTHTGYQEGWEREFPPTGGVRGDTHGVSRGVGKGFPTHGGSSHPRGEFTHTQGIKKGGKGISHPRGEFTHTGYQEGWERDFHTGYQEGWERDFPPTGGVHTHTGGKGISHPHTHGVSRRVGKGVHTHGGMSLTGDVV